MEEIGKRKGRERREGKRENKEKSEDRVRESRDRRVRLE